MALSAATIKATILVEMNNVLTIEDATKADDFAEFMSQTLFKVLTVQASTVLNNGADSGGDTLIDLTGVIV